MTGKAAHALLGASNAERWGACPISVTAPGGSATNEAAAEGTLGHEIADKVLREQPYPAVGSQHKVDGFTFTITEDFLCDVRAYVDYVQSRPWVGGYSAESQVNYSYLLEVPFGVAWGTTDCKGFTKDPITGEGVLEVIDLKMGRKGVDPDWNPQGMMYAAGVIDEHRTIAPLPGNMKVRITIFQPRHSYTAKSWLTMVSQVEEFVFSQRHAAQAAVAFVAGTQTPLQVLQFPETPGGHCHYCPRKASCKAHTALAKRAATATEIRWDPELFNMRSSIESFFKELESIAYEQAMTGAPFPGTKLVQNSRGGNPTFLRTEAEVKARAAELNVAVTQTTLLTPAKVRDAFYKANMPAEEVASFVSKPTKGFKIVSTSEAGEAVVSDIGKDFVGV